MTNIFHSFFVTTAVCSNFGTMRGKTAILLTKRDHSSCFIWRYSYLYVSEYLSTLVSLCHSGRRVLKKDHLFTFCVCFPLMKFPTKQGADWSLKRRNCPVRWCWAHTWYLSRTSRTMSVEKIFCHVGKFQIVCEYNSFW